LESFAILFDQTLEFGVGSQPLLFVELFVDLLLQKLLRDRPSFAEAQELLQNQRFLLFAAHVPAFQRGSRSVILQRDKLLVLLLLFFAHNAGSRIFTGASMIELFLLPPLCTK